MFEKICKPLGVIICLAAFLWAIYTSYIFYGVVIDWVDLKISGFDLLFGFLLLVLKNLPSFLILKIVKGWYE